jgi:Transposase DDE domain
MSGLHLSCLPHKVYDFLYLFKGHFRCAQGRHFLLFCWLLVALILDQGKGTLKGLSRHLPPRIRYWALLRMVRSGQWDAQELLTEMVGHVLPWLPAPADGVLYLLGDSTLKQKRGQKHPLGRKARLNEYAAYTFGFEMVLLVACWDHYRIPVALAVLDPEVKGHQNLLFREMLQAFEPPRWARRVVVLGDAGFAANKNLAVIAEKGYYYVFAMARTRKFSDGKHLSDLVRHLPKSRYRRVASYKPDGRRRDYWVFTRQAQLHNVGDVTLLLSKRRRNEGPKQTKIIVTNLPPGKATTAGAILSCYARRWDIEVMFKELKGGLHLGRMQVTKDKARVERSVVLPVLAYLLLLRLYGRSASSRQEVSLFQLKHRFSADVWQEQWQRSEQRWGKKLDQLRLAA